jgi:hypothetical protein
VELDTISRLEHQWQSSPGQSWGLRAQSFTMTRSDSWLLSILGLIIFRRHRVGGEGQARKQEGGEPYPNLDLLTSDLLLFPNGSLCWAWDSQSPWRLLALPWWPPVTVRGRKPHFCCC